MFCCFLLFLRCGAKDSTERILAQGNFVPLADVLLVQHCFEAHDSDFATLVAFASQNCAKAAMVKDVAYEIYCSL